MLASYNDIVNYIPQRKPFVMVDSLIAVERDRATTAFEILADNVLVCDGFFCESGMVENIAQTVAAQAGYNAHIQNKPTPLGYIANIKDLKVFDLPPIGAILTTTVRVVNQVFDMTLCQGEVRVGDLLLCQCEIRVFVKPSTNS